MRNVIALAFVVALLAACGAPQPAGITITEARATPTPGGVDVSAGYLTITNGGPGDDMLVAVSSPRAARVELHDMSMDGAVMRMRALEQLATPAVETVSLAPGGAHLMFVGIAQPFGEGEEIPVQLTFARAGVVNLTLPVRQN